jgi:uncharacterized membrane protein YphA (DoxX/SURF4 family)
MRTNPFYDVWLFLIGAQPDQVNLGFGRWIVTVLFLGLLAGSIAIAVREWRVDPAQRTAAHAVTWLFRTMMGAMWFQGALWKLPLPRSPGFHYWTEQLAEHAAFEFHRTIVRDVILPWLPVFQAPVFLLELSMGISLMLGFAVRLASAVGILFVLHLWLGLYLHPHEWPWLFWFMVFTLGLFIVHNAGRSLGLDATLRRSPPSWAKGRLGRLYALAS